jgi:hypothetical protein
MENMTQQTIHSQKKISMESNTFAGTSDSHETVSQRKCLRFIYNRYSYSPSRKLFTEQILPLKQLNKYNLIMLAFKVSHNYLMNNVELRLVADVHRYKTRQRNHFYVENYQTRFGFSNFFTRGMIEYNNLNPQIRNIINIGRFKRELRHMLLEQFLTDGN